MRGDKECPFSDVTKSGRVWRKVPENGARSVKRLLLLSLLQLCVCVCVVCVYVCVNVVARARVWVGGC